MSNLALYILEDNDFTAVGSSVPLKSLLYGKDATEVTQLLFVRNTSEDTWYSNVTLTTHLAGAISYGFGLGPFGVEPFGGGVSESSAVKLFAGRIQPNTAGWDAITVGNTVTIGSVGSAGNPDTTTYHPVWMKLAASDHDPIRVYTDVSVVLKGTESPT